MNNNQDNTEKKQAPKADHAKNEANNNKFKKKKYNKFHNKKKNIEKVQNKESDNSVLPEGAKQENKQSTQERVATSPEKNNHKPKNKNNNFKNKKNHNNDKAKQEVKIKEKTQNNEPQPKEENIEFIEDTSLYEAQNENKLNEFRNNGLTGETVEIVGIKFKQGGKLYYFSPNGIKFNENDNVIVETVRGLEMGFVSVVNKEIDTGKIVSQLKSVVRAATPDDMEKHLINKQTEEKAKKIFTQKVADHKLEMQLRDVELTFDNTKLIFYFTAEGRVDFRELVKDLASVFHTRIELRQIGVRDEAKQLGGLGICGQPFCCKRFLSDFAQVSIKMAKDQNLSLASSKISGTCGRLMCCLSFEQKVYEMEYATFPRVDSVVITPSGKGVITESNFLNGKIKVKMNSDGMPVIKTFTAKEIKVIGHVKTNEDIPDEVKKLED